MPVCVRESAECLFETGVSAACCVPITVVCKLACFLSESHGSHRILVDF